jgi:sulfate transport system ATP-binding protein
VTGATVSERANLGWTVRYTLRFDDDVEVEYSVTREQADGRLGLDIGQRIYLYVKPEAMMGFEPEDIDSAPIL